MSDTPWLGFAVRSGRNHVIVKDVADGGPADEAGVQDGDKLLSMCGTALTDLASFRSCFRRFCKIGSKLSLELERKVGGVDLSKTVNLTVGTKRREKIEVVKLTSLSEIDELLRIRPNLQQKAELVFLATDEDASGLITKTEFVNSMKGWIDKHLLRNLSHDSDIEDIFHRADDDRSGYLSRSEFPSAIALLLQAIQRSSHRDKASSSNGPSPSSSSDYSVISGSGKPWLGFAVGRAHKGKMVQVKDVADDGPANKAGIEDGDYILSLGGQSTSSLAAFREAFRKYAVVGQTIDMSIMKGKSEMIRNVKINVKTRAPRTYRNVPPMDSVDDLESILSDERKLGQVSEAAFASADEDMSGLITMKEFKAAIHKWMGQWVLSKISDSDIEHIFHKMDIDKSGYLALSEFTPALVLLIQSILRKCSSSSNPRPKEKEKQRAPISVPRRPPLSTTNQQPVVRTTMYGTSTKQAYPHYQPVYLPYDGLKEERTRSKSQPLQYNNTRDISSSPIWGQSSNSGIRNHTPIHRARTPSPTPPPFRNSTPPLHYNNSTFISPSPSPIPIRETPSPYPQFIVNNSRPPSPSPVVYMNPSPIRSHSPQFDHHSAWAQPIQQQYYHPPNRSPSPPPLPSQPLYNPNPPLHPLPISNPLNPKVYMEVTISRVPIGRMIFELFADILPRTAENVRQLCTGQRGIGEMGFPLSYEGTLFHRIIPGFMFQGGDITHRSGQNGDSIYGPRFHPEPWSGKALRHLAGSLSLVAGKEGHASQFIVCTNNAPHLDGKHAVCGMLLQGWGVLRKVEACGSANGQPTKVVLVGTCGQYHGHIIPEHPK